MNTIKTIFSILLVSLVISLFGTGPVRAQEKKQLQVVTSFYPIYEFTKAVVGDTGQVSLLIGAGTEVHEFEPSTKTIAKLQAASDFVYLDDSMETWVEKTRKSLNHKTLTVIKASGNMILAAGTETEEEHASEGHSHAYDPHLWLSPARAQTLVENIRDGLIKAHPELAETLTKNAAKYLEKLQALDKDYREALGQAKQKSFVTQHAAFGYLALDYGLKQVAITGVSADAEPSAKRLVELSRYVKKYQIKYIYFEENASQALAKTLAEEVGVTTAVLNPLESLTKKQIQAGQDYFSVMRANLAALRLTTDLAGKEISPEHNSDQTVEKGYFKDKDIKDRTLADWSGNWQSLYPYLLDGTLDPVWDYKAKSKQDMTAQEYKDYYTKGYQTDVEKISIDGHKKTMTFVQKGVKKTFSYRYVGYKVLTYPKGNRGVRYLFESQDKDAGQFKYVQFSDHGIAPQKAEHFHLFWGSDSQEALFKELENWPTYYPDKLSGHDIAQALVAH
ncbi:zinc ABC transporter substrate-binding protein AdcA [Streptococcus cuniculipharyngis]|uniref:Zinc ABC transporter substrate-binding protein AdcA n=1 Tax=Streptococcus cuniculipharyngis TaxID=1562651 RepID=A0A5C5SE40_9STRE|nr:zinc ABC transporter substrate-binding protein AdcA [Streptococcus cuniculipharyngis]TWS99039.1 zinc ABC transporter substrate-binding protein AdcA [Streptococcus cuniculipharyngis]